MKAVITIIIILLLTISCRYDKGEDGNQIVTFDITDLPEISNVKLSDLDFVDIEYVPLETNKESMLSNIDVLSFNWGNYRIIAHNNFYIIKLWNDIFKFRDDGLFICKIGTIGRGPNEYTVAHDIDVNPEDHKIYIVSAWQKKFNVYSDSGVFLRTFLLPVYAPVTFRFVDGNILCYSDNLQGDIENSYILMDTNGIILKEFPNKYPFTKHESGAFGFTHENLFYYLNNQLFKKEVYSDTIYAYKNMDFRPHLVIRVGDRLITPEARSESDVFEIGENYINPLNLFEFGDFVYYSFIYEAKLNEDFKLYGFFGSGKNDFQAVINLEQGLINDLDGGPNILPYTTKDDNTVITIIDALTLKNHVASREFQYSTPKYPEKKKELEKLAASLKETDNPVLVLVRLKE